MATPSPPPKPSGPATDEQKLEILRAYPAFVFDLDGTIWAGDELLPGAKETLEMLRYMVGVNAAVQAVEEDALKGKKVFFVTNNSTRSRAQVMRKLKEMGLQASTSEVYSSGYAAGQFLRSKWFGKKVYCIGEAGMTEEMRIAGIKALGGPSHADKKIDANGPVVVDKDVGAVLVGLDKEINYFKIQYALTCLLTIKDCMFIASNTDARGNLIAGGQEWAGAGSMVGALAAASEQSPIVVGKPSTFMMDVICKDAGLYYNQICVVGDRLDTDILWGNVHGCGTLLVLTGVTSEPALMDSANEVYPSHYVTRLDELLTVKDKLPSSCVIS